MRKVVIYPGLVGKPIVAEVEFHDEGYIGQYSWGSWAGNDQAFISFKDFERLLTENGEAVVMQEKRLSA